MTKAMKYVGFENLSLGTVRCAYKGKRTVGIVRPSTLVAAMVSAGVDQPSINRASMKAWLTGLGDNELQDFVQSHPEVKIAEVHMGEVLYTPPASLVWEMPTGGDCYGVRLSVLTVGAGIEDELSMLREVDKQEGRNTTGIDMVWAGVVDALKAMPPLAAVVVQAAAAVADMDVEGVAEGLIDILGDAELEQLAEPADPAAELEELAVPAVPAAELLELTVPVEDAPAVQPAVGADEAKFVIVFFIFEIIFI